MTETITPGQIIPIGDKAPRWRSEKIESEYAERRNKKTELVTDETQQYDSLISKTATKVWGERNNVRGLKREFHFLEQLKETGITPQPLVLKVNTQENEARLLMEKLPGESLEKIDTTSETIKAKFNDIATGIMQAMDTIHKKGVLIVDINEGTFLAQDLETTEKQPKIHVVDFEVAEEINQLSFSAVQDRLKRWYETEDPGFASISSQQGFHLTKEMAIKTEYFLGAKVIVEKFLGDDYAAWDVDRNRLSEAERRVYEQQLAKIKPLIEKESLKTLSNLRSLVPIWELPSINEIMSWKTNASMVNITLPYLLKQNGIEAEQSVVSFLQKALSPSLVDRPSQVANDTDASIEDVQPPEKIAS